MADFNYLKGNESDFPHVNNVNVFKYDNGFDYGRFDAPQMELQICSVPWDMGEAHIGNRTISGIGNVVFFETKAKRDKWFDDIPDSQCYRFTTKFKELHRSLEIDVPIPYDMCAKHNYLRVKYNKLANDNSPIQYEGNDGLREWFWFIREVEFLAPSTTRLHLLDDAFQTWIYDVNVSGMVLERGHAPMFAVDVDDYLADPVNESGYLLTEDVNFGTASVCKHIDAYALNSGNMHACIATTAEITSSWGWTVPASSYYVSDGVPSVNVFAVRSQNLNAFLNSVERLIPQFKQTIQAIWFASATLVTLGDSFRFASTTCYHVTAGRKTLDFCNIEKGLFGYDGRYAEIAKLYTSPYAHIEVTDESGNVDIVKIEDTTGKLEINVAMSLAYPFITVDAHLLGAGGGAARTVSFRNLDDRTFDVSGQWYDTLRSWNVPTFAVVLDAATEYDYSTHFDRAQRVVDYSTAQTNANASANTMKTNADAAADTDTANADLVIASNTATTGVANQAANDGLYWTQAMNVATKTVANQMINDTAIATIAAQNKQAAVGAISAVASGALSSVNSLASPSPNKAGAVTGFAQGAFNAIGTLMAADIANGLTQAETQAHTDFNDRTETAANNKSSEDVNIQTGAASDTTDIQNDLTEGTTANSVATQKANASRDQATQQANAARTASAAQSAIDNDVAQAALRAPFMYGTFGSGDSAATKPMAMFAHIVTQSKSAISRAGDEFLRYGYTFDGQWDFDGNWNVGKYFTYWKLRDFWVSNLNVPDMYMDKLRFFLFGGVTVWRSPEYIGNVTVYDNFD